MLTPTLSPSTFPEGNPNSNFSSVGGGVAAQPVLTTIYDLAPWYQMREVFARHSFAPSFRMLLKTFGSQFSRGVAAPTTGHYEEDWDASLVHVGSIVTPAGGAGNDMTIALDAASMFDTAVEVGGSARKASYPQPNQRILLPDGTMAYIKSKTVTTDPHRLVIAPVDSANDLDDSVTAGEAYFVVDNAWGEGTALPIGMLKRLYKYTNTFQIIKEAFGATGSGLTTEFYPTFQRVGENIAMILKPQMMRAFERDSSGALLFGQQMNNITTTDTQAGYDINVSGTEGLITFISSNGYTDNYTPGSYALSDLYVVARLLEQERIGSHDIVTWDGFDLYAEREQVLQNLFQYTLPPKMIDSFMPESGPGVATDNWQPSQDTDFVAWLGFKGCKVAGYHFLFKMLHEFNEAIGAGASAYDYTKWGIYMPIGTTVDRKTNQPVGNFGYEWRELTGYKREVVMATIAGAGVGGQNGYVPATVVSNEYDYTKMGIVSEIAFHGACGNRIVTQRPA